MNSPTLADLIRPEAIALRRLGASRRQIKQILGIGGNSTVDQALAGEPPPEWTRRPQAKDELRARARKLREQGLNYNAIAAELGVSKSSVSLWVRDLPRPARLSYEECRKRAADGVRRYWEAERQIRETNREQVTAAATAEIGALSHREILIAGAVAYWCEGAKNKPYHRHDRVTFTNSDPALVLLFLRFLEAVGVSKDRLSYRVQIHETADVEAAHAFWLAVTAARMSEFRTPSLKRHNPKTNRKNVDAGYHGCLRVDVMRSSDIYRRIEGWVRAVAPGPDTTILP